MYYLSTHFEQLLRDVRPPQDRIELAQTLPADVRGDLKQSKTFPTTHRTPSWSAATARRCRRAT